jgi:hypothetical protein
MGDYEAKGVGHERGVELRERSLEVDLGKARGELIERKAGGVGMRLFLREGS